MADLQAILSGGDITGMNIGGVTAGDAVVEKGELDAGLALVPSAMTYDYAQVANHTVTNDVYEEVLRLTTVSRPTGVYKAELSMIYSLNSTTTSAFFRFSIDGGTTWTEVRKEPKDNTDLVPEAYPFTVSHTAGARVIIIQARKENAADVLNIAAMDIMFERRA